MMKEDGFVQLDVYIEPGCGLCKRALQLAREVRDDYPGVTVRVIDMVKKREGGLDVFAVPTFALNGQVVSLGNPGRADLRQRIEALLEAEIG